jgi:hypothetical protein
MLTGACMPRAAFVGAAAMRSVDPNLEQQYIILTLKGISF